MDLAKKTILFVSLLWVGWASAIPRDCGPGLPWQRWAVESLHPTQFAFGMREVNEKATDLAKMGRKELQKDLCNNPIPVVLGPGDTAYVIDHHHLGVALLTAHLDDAYVDIREDWRKETEAAFWKQMDTSHFLYLRDETGALRTVQELPTKLTDLKDDPYRSLAYYVRKNGGFKKVSALYAEFQWAEFFRTRVVVGTSDKDFQKAVKKACQLAHSADASSLPGYEPLSLLGH